MSNQLYPAFKKTLETTGLNLLTATIKAQLVDTGGYTLASADQYLSAIPSAARIGTPSAAFTTKAVSAADVFSADNITFTSVPAGSGTAATVEALVIFHDTGDPTTSDLIAYFDTCSGLPFTPSGGNETVTWNAGGIFAL